MPIIAHKQIKKTGLSEAYLEVKNRIDQLEEENTRLLDASVNSEILIKAQDKEIKKLKAALNKLEKENEKLRNPRIWKNDGEL